MPVDASEKAISLIIHAKKYHSCWVDSMGMMASGESTYDPITGSWYWKAVNPTP